MREKYSLNIITPVFIGNNSYLSPYADYFFLNNRIYYLTDESFISNLTNNNLSEYLNNFYNTISSNKRNFDLYEILKQINVDPIAAAGYSVPCLINPENRNIRKTIATSHKVIIPGSSIKGAIRIAILYDYLKNTDMGQKSLEVYIRKLSTTVQLFQGKQKEVLSLESSQKYLKSYKDKQNYKRKIDSILLPIRQRMNTFLRLLESDLYGNNPEFDFMKFLAISDSNSISKEQCIYIDEVRRIRLKDKRTIGFSQLAEIIKEGTKFEFTISLNKLNNTVFNLEYFSGITIQKILEMVNSFSREQIKNEINLYKNDSAFKNIIMFNNKLLDQLIKKYLLRLGANKTFLFNTVSSMIPENIFTSFREIMRIGENPLTGKLVRGRFPSTLRFVTSKSQIGTVPGWCLLSLIPKQSQ